MLMPTIGWHNLIDMLHETRFYYPFYRSASLDFPIAVPKEKREKRQKTKDFRKWLTKLEIKNDSIWLTVILRRIVLTG